MVTILCVITEIVIVVKISQQTSFGRFRLSLLLQCSSVHESVQLLTCHFCASTCKCVV